MKKLNVKAYKRHKIIDFIGVFFLICVLLFVWQLYRGPIAIPFLKPYIIKALNHDDTDYLVTLDSVNLEFVRSIKPLRIIANNVVYRKTNDELVVNAPKTSVSFSIKALLQGIIAPSSIEIINPTMYIFTNYGVDKEKEADAINQKKLAYYFDYMESFLERFNSEDNSYPESFINDIDIRNAEVELHEVDLGRKWVLSDVNYRFDRNLTNLETEVSALVKFNDVPSSVGIEAVYRPISDKVALQFYFSDLIPENLLQLLDAQNAKPTKMQIDVPLNGRIDVLIDVGDIVKNRNDLMKSLNDAVEKIGFEFEGGQGHIAFSPNAQDDYPISSLLLKGEITGGLDKVNIQKASLNLDGQQAFIGVEASGLKDYFLKSSMEKMQVKLTADVNELKVDDLYRYWPRFISEEAWDWCNESMRGGVMSNAAFTFDFAYDKKSQSLVFTDLHGTADVADASLDYLSGMPKITNIYGKADFYKDKIVVNLDKGVSSDIILNNGYVELYDLDKYDNFAKISLQAVGSIPDILKLIDNQPLGYTSAMGINPDSIKGSAETTLALEFELKQNLTPEEVKVDITSVLQDVVIKQIIDDKDIEAKKLDLTVTNRGMLLSGVTGFEGIPVNLLWDEKFLDKDYNSRYQLRFNFDANLRKKLGLDFAALNAPYIKGSIPTQAVITRYADDKTIIDVKADLQPADIDYSFLGFKKKSGISGAANAKINIAADGELQIPQFSLSEPEFNLKGKMVFDKNKNIKQIDIADIKGPKTSANAKIEFIAKPEKLKVTVSGNSYNLSDLFARDDDDVRIAQQKREQLKAQGKRPQDNNWEDTKTADINIAVNSLWTNNDVAIRNFAGTAKMVNGIGIEEMHLIGNFPTNSKKKSAKPASLKLDYVPRPNKEHLLTIESNDAGSTMKFLRLYDSMRGGSLSINALRRADKKIVGHAKIRNCNIYNTPVLAKLLTVASFTGMVNLLTGDGIVFSHFDAPFEYQNGILQVNEAKAFGSVMGITADGQYDFDFQEFNMKGLLAPAYGLNTFIGSIPVVGKLLSGKDGTVFAANYSITGNIDDPNISINPLSALSPNSLKELFSSLFENKNGK